MHSVLIDFKHTQAAVPSFFVHMGMKASNSSLLDGGLAVTANAACVVLFENTKQEGQKNDSECPWNGIHNQRIK